MSLSLILILRTYRVSSALYYTAIKENLLVKKEEGRSPPLFLFLSEDHFAFD